MSLFIEDVTAGSNLNITVPRDSTVANLIAKVASQTSLALEMGSFLEFNGRRLHNSDEKIDGLGLASFSTLRLCSPHLLGGSFGKKNSNVAPTPSDRIELINTKTPSKSTDYEEDLLNGSQIRLLTAYDAIAENRNVEVYNSADEACDPIRIKMLKRVDVTSSSHLAEDQRRLLKHIIHSLRQTGGGPRQNHDLLRANAQT